MNSFTYLLPDVAPVLTREQLINLGIPETVIESGEMRGDLKTYGPWQRPISYRALATSSRWDDSKGYTKIASMTVFGMATMTNCRESGYCLEGRVSIGGKKHRAFTSSQLFTVDGKPINIATIHVCGGAK